jgi:hypothetical protein
MKSRWFDLEETLCDSDGFYNGCLVPSDQAKVLYAMSWIGSITGLVGILCGHPYLGAGVCIGAEISRLYWSKPVYKSWRRYLDMGWIQLLIWSHLWIAIASPQVLGYLFIQILGAVAYGISWYFHRIGDRWGSTIFHAILTLCANLSLLVLYLS